MTDRYENPDEPLDPFEGDDDPSKDAFSDQGKNRDDNSRDEQNFAGNFFKGGPFGGGNGNGFGFSFGPFMGGDGSDDDSNGDNASFFATMQRMGDFVSGLAKSLTKGNADPINLNTARSAAVREVGSDPTIRSGQHRAVEDAVGLADMWLDTATSFPSGVQHIETWVPRNWVETNLPTWIKLLSPMIERMNTAGIDGLPEEAAEQIQQLTKSMGGLMNIIRGLTGLSFGTQLGISLGKLSKEMTCSSEMGLPLESVGTAALLPNAIEQLSTDLELSQRDLLVFIAAREAAYQRLWKHVPWLAPRLVGAIEDYANGVVIDYSDISSSTAEMGLSPEMLQDLSKMMEAMQNMGSIELTPKIHYTHTQALDRLETMLALVEGWVNVVVMEAIGERIPSAGKMSEVWRRRRASASAAEESLKETAGIELRPRRINDAVVLWRRITDACGADKRDNCWGHPDLLPRTKDLDNPAGFIDHLLDESGDILDADWAKFEEELQNHIDEENGSDLNSAGQHEDDN